MHTSIAKICAGLGIEIISPLERPGPFTTAAGATIGRLLHSHGEGHVTLVLRTIVESEGNAGELNAPTIWALSDIILAHPIWANSGLRWLEAFDHINLHEIRVAAQANREAVRHRAAIATMVYRELCSAFNSSLSEPQQYQKRAPMENDLLYGVNAIAKYIDGMTLQRCQYMIKEGHIPVFTMPGSSTKCARKSVLNLKWAEFAEKGGAGAPRQ